MFIIALVIYGWAMLRYRVMEREFLRPPGIVEEPPSTQDQFAEFSRRLQEVLREIGDERRSREQRQHELAERQVGLQVQLATILKEMAMHSRGAQPDASEVGARAAQETPDTGLPPGPEWEPDVLLLAKEAQPYPGGSLLGRTGHQVVVDAKIEKQDARRLCARVNQVRKQEEAFRNRLPFLTFLDKTANIGLLMAKRIGILYVFLVAEATARRRRQPTLLGLAVSEGCVTIEFKSPEDLDPDVAERLIEEFSASHEC